MSASFVRDSLPDFGRTDPVVRHSRRRNDGPGRFEVHNIDHIPEEDLPQPVEKRKQKPDNPLDLPVPDYSTPRPPKVPRLTPAQEDDNTFPLTLQVMHDLIFDLALADTTKSEANTTQATNFIRFARIANFFDEQSGLVQRRYQSSLNKIANIHAFPGVIFPTNIPVVQRVLTMMGQEHAGLRQRLLAFGETLGYQLLAILVHSASFRTYISNVHATPLQDQKTIFRLIRENVTSIEYISRMNGIEWRPPVTTTDPEFVTLYNILDTDFVHANHLRANWHHPYTHDSKIVNTTGVIRFEHGPDEAKLSNDVGNEALGHRYDWAFGQDGVVLFQPSVQITTGGRRRRPRTELQRTIEQSVWHEDDTPQTDPRRRTWLEPVCGACGNRVPGPSAGRANTMASVCDCKVDQLLRAPSVVELLVFGAIKEIGSRDLDEDDVDDHDFTPVAVQGGEASTKSAQLPAAVPAVVPQETKSSARLTRGSGKARAPKNAGASRAGPAASTRGPEHAVYRRRPAVTARGEIRVRTLSNLPANTLLAEYVGELHVARPSDTTDEETQFVKYQYSLRARNQRLRLTVRTPQDDNDGKDDRGDKDNDDKDYGGGGPSTNGKIDQNKYEPVSRRTRAATRAVAAKGNTATDGTKNTGKDDTKNTMRSANDGSSAVPPTGKQETSSTGQGRDVSKLPLPSNRSDALQSALKTRSKPSTADANGSSSTVGSASTSGKAGETANTNASTDSNTNASGPSKATDPAQSSQVEAGRARQRALGGRGKSASKPGTGRGVGKGKGRAPPSPSPPPPSSTSSSSLPSSSASDEDNTTHDNVPLPPHDRVPAVRIDASQLGNWTRFVRHSPHEAEANVEFVAVSIGPLRKLMCRTRGRAVGWGSELVAFKPVAVVVASSTSGQEQNQGDQGQLPSQPQSRPRAAAGLDLGPVDPL